MKAIRTLTPKASPRLPSTTTPATRRPFHNTPQEASSSQLSTHQHQHPYHHSSNRPKHDTGKMAYSSEAARRQGGGDGIAFDEDVIEELRPIFAERARAGEGRSRQEGPPRGLGTGRGAEWVW